MLGTKPKPSDNHTSESTAALRIAMFSIHSCPMGKLGTRDTGGMNVYVREVARELGRRGHHVDVYTRFHGDGHGPIMRVSKTVRFIHVMPPPAQFSCNLPDIDIHSTGIPGPQF
ncbi:MAG TPA: hypothetical protein EYP90_10590, partial [Chromatiaceae bacterium]|nr:hypothetical protein [Chromatiaceae bacterium]